jgi:hypothetical protein
VSGTEKFAPRPLEDIGGGIGGVPFGDDVVIGNVFQPVADGDEVGSFRISRAGLGVDRVEEAVGGEFRVKDEADEAAFQAIIDTVGEGGGDVRIYVRLVVGVDQIEKSARVVGEAAAIGEIADVADAGPAGRTQVLVGGTKPAGVGQADQILDLNRNTALDDRFRNRIAGDLSRGRANEAQGQNREDAGNRRTHECLRMLHGKNYITARGEGGEPGELQNGSEA